MKKFNFRLQKVLEYRQMLEQWAKEAYLEARTGRLEADLEMIGIQERRQRLVHQVVDSLPGRLTLEGQLTSLDLKEVEQRVVVNVLAAEEEHALNEWTEKRVEVESLQKMYDKQYQEWQLDLDRKLQAELDEWAVRSRAA